MQRRHLPVLMSAVVACATIVYGQKVATQDDDVLRADKVQPKAAAVAPALPDLGSSSGSSNAGCTNNSLTTTFASNNGGSAGWMTFKDITVTNPNGIDISAFDINDNNAGTSGSPIEIDVYVSPGGTAGKETDPTQWTLVATGAGVAEPENSPTFVDTADFNIAAGVWGLAIHYRVGSGPAYTNGDGTNETYENCDMMVQTCCSISGLFSGTIFSPRVFNGTIYTCTQAPAVTYCTAKTALVCGPSSVSSGGCPSASSSSGFEISASPARGNRSGVLLYSDSGRAAFPFQGGILCVNPAPLRRSSTVNSGGTNGLCDGSFTLDMNCFASGNCGGNPDPSLQMIGQQINTQFWGRDSVATGSLLSDGLEYFVAP